MLKKLRRRDAASHTTKHPGAIGGMKRRLAPVRRKTSCHRRRVSAGRSRTDWARVDATADADIATHIRRHPEEVEFTDAMLAAARWVMPEKKVPISFRVDPEVLAFFKAGGDGYQSRMNAVLRGYVRERGSKSGKLRTGYHRACVSRREVVIGPTS